MRRKAKLWLATSVLLLSLTSTVLAQQHSPDTKMTCGAFVDGMALCLSSREPGTLQLEIRNTGAKDAVLNLGILNANGARQYLSAITLTLTDAAGNVHHGELALPPTAGRDDPFIVPLPSGASLTVPLDVSKYFLYDASGHMEESRPDPSKPYRVQAQFTGKRVSEPVSPDLKGIVLMPFWTGTMVSNSVATMGK